MTVRINKQKINLREKLTEFEDKVNFDEVVRGLGVYPSDGNVGIGTANPDSQLHILKGDQKTYSANSIVSDLHISRKNTENTVNESVGIQLSVTGWSGSTTGVAGITAIQQGNASTADLTFQLRDAGVIGEKMRITHDGRVGIGTTNPGAPLHILTSNTTDTLLLESTGGSNLNAPDLILYRNSATPADNDNLGIIKFRGVNDGTVGVDRSDIDYALIQSEIIDASNDAEKGSLSFWTRGVDGIDRRMTINSDGNVGIGTTNPGAYNLVLNRDSGDSRMKISCNPSSQASLFFGEDAGGGGTPAWIQRFGSNHSTRPNKVEIGAAGSGSWIAIQGDGQGDILNVRGSGNVGIGTTNPSGKLHVSTSNTLISGTVSIVASSMLTASGSKFLSELYVGDSLKIEGQDTYTVVSINSDTQVELNSNITASGGESLYRVNTKELLCVNEKTQNVGIGTTSPDHKLHVDGGDIKVSSDSATNNGDGLPAIFFCETPNTGDEACIVFNGDLEAGANNYLGFGVYDITNALEDTVAEKKLRTTLNILRDGNVGIGTTSPGTYKLYINGTARVSGGDVTSDDRVKHNEQAVVGAIETLGKITPKKYIKTTEMYEANHDFELDADGNPVDADGEPVEHTVEAGVIAQQVLGVPELAFMVSPEGVDEDGNVTSPHGLNYNSLFTYAIAAIQEQQSIIEDLKSRIETLESK